MYTLRKIKSNTQNQTNIFLGNQYRFITKIYSKDNAEFNNCIETVFSGRKEQTENVYAFFIGNITVPLYFDEESYIMTGNGKFF